MKSIKFLNREKTHEFSVEGSGHIFEVVVMDVNKKDLPKVLDTRDPLTTLISATKFLVDYARENGLVSAVWIDIEDDSNDKIYQGETLEGNDTASISEKELIEKYAEFVENDDRVRYLELDLKERIQALKADINGQISNIQEVNEKIKPIVKSGVATMRCNATWERDSDAGLMLFIRTDNGKVLEYREMVESDEFEQTELPIEEGSDIAEDSDNNCLNCSAEEKYADCPHFIDIVKDENSAFDPNENACINHETE